MIFEFFMFFFTIVISFSSFSVVTAKNPVHAVFYLILTFCLSSLYLLLFAVDFLALLFIVVYVGAIAVLFLFVVMMLDLRQMNSEFVDEEIYGDLAILLLLLAFFLFTLFFLQPFWFLFSFNEYNLFSYVRYLNLLDDFSNIQLIGEQLYTFFSPVFILAGYLLLLAMIGSIMLTLKHHITNKKQNSFFQLKRKAETTIRKIKVNF